MMSSGFRRRFTALVRKEVRQLLRDASNLAVGLLLPGVMILLFGYGLSFDVKDAPVAVVLEDRSPMARDVLSGLDGSAYVAPLWVASMPEAERRMRAGDVDAILRVPADFSRQLAAGNARVQLLLNGVDSNTANAVSGYVGGALATWAQQQADRAGAQRHAPVVSGQEQGLDQPHEVRGGQQLADRADHQRHVAQVEDEAGQHHGRHEARQQRHLAGLELVARRAGDEESQGQRHDEIEERRRDDDQQ